MHRSTGRVFVAVCLFAGAGLFAPAVRAQGEEPSAARAKKRGPHRDKKAVQAQKSHPRHPRQTKPPLCQRFPHFRARRLHSGAARCFAARGRCLAPPADVLPPPAAPSRPRARHVPPPCPSPQPEPDLRPRLVFPAGCGHHRRRTCRLGSNGTATSNSIMAMSVLVGREPIQP